MNSGKISFNTLKRTTLLVGLCTLAACGAPEDKQTCSQTLAVLTAGLCLIGEVTYSSGPSSQPPTGSDSDSGSGTIPPPPGSNTVVIRRVTEYEPNSTLNNANPVAFRTASADEHVGIDITGSVSQSDDASDFFVVTPWRSGHFLIYLCTETCGTTLDSDQVYLMIYDQSQNTIASTSVGSVVTQRIGVDLYAGLAYYVEVNGYNSGSSTVDYRLVLID